MSMNYVVVLTSSRCLNQVGFWTVTEQNLRTWTRCLHRVSADSLPEGENPLSSSLTTEQNFNGGAQELGGIQGHICAPEGTAPVRVRRWTYSI